MKEYLIREGFKAARTSHDPGTRVVSSILVVTAAVYDGKIGLLLAGYRTRRGTIIVDKEDNTLEANET